MIRNIKIRILYVPWNGYAREGCWGFKLKDCYKAFTSVEYMNDK